MVVPSDGVGLHLSEGMGNELMKRRGEGDGERLKNKSEEKRTEGDGRKVRWVDSGGREGEEGGIRKKRLGR